MEVEVTQELVSLLEAQHAQIDDGQGSEPSQLDARQGVSLGLQVMQGRAASVGGRLEVGSAAGRGTLVRLWVPPSAAGGNGG